MEPEKWRTKITAEAQSAEEKRNAGKLLDIKEAAVIREKELYDSMDKERESTEELNPEILKLKEELSKARRECIQMAGEKREEWKKLEGFFGFKRKDNKGVNSEKPEGKSGESFDEKIGLSEDKDMEYLKRIYGLKRYDLEKAIKRNLEDAGVSKEKLEERFKEACDKINLEDSLAIYIENTEAEIKQKSESNPSWEKIVELNSREKNWFLKLPKNTVSGVISFAGKNFSGVRERVKELFMEEDERETIKGKRRSEKKEKENEKNKKESEKEGANNKKEKILNEISNSKNKYGIISDVIKNISLGSREQWKKIKEFDADKEIGENQEINGKFNEFKIKCIELFNAEGRIEKKDTIQSYITRMIEKICEEKRI